MLAFPSITESARCCVRLPTEYVGRIVEFNHENFPRLGVVVSVDGDDDGPVAWTIESFSGERVVHHGSVHLWNLETR